MTTPPPSLSLSKSKPRARHRTRAGSKIKKQLESTPTLPTTKESSYEPSSLSEDIPPNQNTSQQTIETVDQYFTMPLRDPLSESFFAQPLPPFEQPKSRPALGIQSMPFVREDAGHFQARSWSSTARLEKSVLCGVSVDVP